MDAIETLYRQHASAVFRFAWGLCGDRQVAEDVVSETFVRVLTKAPRIETRTALAYLLAIARNVCISGWRRRRREAPLHAAEVPAAALLEAVRGSAGERLEQAEALCGGTATGSRRLPADRR